MQQCKLCSAVHVTASTPVTAPCTPTHTHTKPTSCLNLRTQKHKARWFFQQLITTLEEQIPTRSPSLTIKVHKHAVAHAHT